MSLNQSRVEKSEAQLRKPGRSANPTQQRNSYITAGKGSGSASAAPPSGSSSASLSSNRSFKKSDGNAQNAHARGTIHAAKPESNISSRPVQNGTYVQSKHGTADSSAPGNYKQVDGSSRATRAPTGSASRDSNTTAATTPVKGEASNPFPLQFGSFSPGFVNGMQIPARTSSAPPNLDEQKRDQARREQLKAAAPVPIPAPKLQVHKKDVILAEKSVRVDSHPPAPQRHSTPAQVPAATTTSVASQKHMTHASSGVPISMQYQQPQVPSQFGGLAMKMQSHGVTSCSLQMQVPLSMGNASQAPLYVPGIQAHCLQQQAMMHQGQGLTYGPQMGHQLTPQVGNMGMGIQPQFPQQPGNVATARRTAVKIRRPDTHEEVKFDTRVDQYTDAGSSALKTHSSVPSESQSISSIPPTHPINYYTPIQSNSYSSSVFFQNPGSVPLTSNAMPSSSARYNYSVGQGGQAMSFMNASTLNPLPMNKMAAPVYGTPEPGSSLIVQASSSSSTTPAFTQIAAKPTIVSHPDKISGASTVTVSFPPGRSEFPRSPKAKLSQPEKDGMPVSENSAHQLNKDLGKEDSSEQKTSVPIVPVSAALSVLSSKSEQTRDVETLKDQHWTSNMEKTTCTQEQQQMKESSTEVNMERSSLNMHESREEIGMCNGDLSTTSNGVLSGVVQEQELELSPPENDVVSHAQSSAPDTYEGSQFPVNVMDVVQNAGKLLTDFHTGCSSSVVGKPLDDDGEIQGLAHLSISPTDDTGTEKSAAISCNQDMVSASYAENIVEDGHDVVKGDSVRTETSTELKSEDNGGKDANLQPEASTIMTESMVQKEKRTDIGAGVGNEGAPSGCLFDNDHDNGIDDALAVDLHKIDEKEPFDSLTAVEDAVPVASLSNPKCQIANATVVSDDSPPAEGSAVDSDVTSAGGSENLNNPVLLTNLLEPKGHIPNGTSITNARSRNKASVEQNRPKIAAGKKKKKKEKEILMKADAAGTDSDLYNAFKSDEKQSAKPVSAAGSNSASVVEMKQPPVSDGSEKDLGAANENEQSRAELEDWENAVIMTPEIKTSNHGQFYGVNVECPAVCSSEDAGKKKYSRDFLMTFSEQYMELPDGFEIGSDVLDTLMVKPSDSARIVDREVHSSARTMDRMGMGSRIDRRGSAADDDKWNKSAGISSGRDARMDAYGIGVTNFRPGGGGGQGVLRSSRGQPSGQHIAGYHPGSLQSLASQGPIRSSSDAERWQRAPGLQKGLIPSPQSPAQIIHKAEKKYEVGKTADEEVLKQRRLKGILNKLTPQNFERLFDQVKEVNIDNAITLTGVISQIFDKALMEPTFCEMYADFCFHLARELPDFNENNEKITFKRVLLNKCQEEFERGEREEAEANRVEEEGEVQLSKEEREERKVKARRRTLGNIRLIGELYKKKMLTERIMHECIKKLLGQYQNPDEEDVEALCKLMSTIGEIIDHPRAKEHMDAYFDMMAKLSTNQKLSSRVRFMLRDAIDLRKNNWRQRRKVEGPKKIEDVHRDAAQERQMQTSRLARGPNIGPPARRGIPPPDFGPRGMIPSASSQPISGTRGFISQTRGYGVQDVRLEDRTIFESRMLSVPLPQRPLDDDTIMLGPQGGLGRGMSVRGQQPQPPIPLSETPGYRRMGLGSSGLDWQHPSPREDAMPRHMADRNVGLPAYDHFTSQERPTSSGSRDSRASDRSLDRSRPSSPNVPSVAGAVQSITVPNISEEHLRSMSVAAIREYYSARNVEEVRLCIKDLRSPSFYPEMIMLWVTDSFDRKNENDRVLLAKLLVSLSKSQDRLLSQKQLIEGFQFVLSILEDTITDSPKAGEYLGRILAELILANIVSLQEIGRLVHEGGEEPGSLLQSGLASDVIVSILEIVQQQKGESGLNEFRTVCKLEDFRPPDPIKSRRLDAFI